MGIKIAIVEDDRRYADTLEQYLLRYGTERDLALQITRFENGAEFLSRTSPMFDLIFMDIEMPVLNGMDTAAALRKTDPLAVLIFVTNLAQYAVRGYEVDALDYIVKPIRYSHFTIKLDKAMRNLPRREQWYALSTENGVVRLDCAHIRYVESQGHTLSFVTDNGTYSTRSSLKSVESTLSPCGFSRISSSCLMNLNYITAVQNNEVLAVGQRFPIGRTRKKQFMEEFTAFLGRRILK